MRLLIQNEDGEVTLTKDLHDNVPPYAILSHTWGLDHDEVTFDDMTEGRGSTKVGYEKISFLAKQAKRDKLQYFWADTCCIDKANLTELSESIVSMFRFYRDAELCYVYLSDVSSRKRDHEGSTAHVWMSSFRESRWFTRGWPLQELIAPTTVLFFSREGDLLGDKGSLASVIQEITGIPVDALQGKPLEDFTIQERLRWASMRNTTKVEDRAYCLLGIFDVSMSLLYGERDKAMARLKDEICKSYRNRLDDVGSSFLTSSTFNTIFDAPETRPSQLDDVLLQRRMDELLQSLAFEQMDSRRATIKSAYSKTCAWFLSCQAYMDWIDRTKLDLHSGLLWIKGKPGAGKSTLVKFAYTQAARLPRNDEILLCYFFNARGDLLEKSTLGMYRSLLFQLFNKAPDLRQSLNDVVPSHLQACTSFWTIDLLRELLTSSVERLGQRRVNCFIDALDECDEQEIRDMILHVEDLGRISDGRFYVCFASRHYPTILIRYGIELVLEDQSGHGEDLSRYVRNQLQIGKGKGLDHVRTDVLEKANGVFMWVVLVIPMLNEEFRRGRVHAVRKRLSEIPEKLGDLFKDILRRDSTNMDDLQLCIQWILFSKRPLEQNEFYYGMMAGLPDQEDFTGEWDPELVSEDDMRRFILDCSKGLAEVTRSRSLPTVQFIHESVRDFLIKDGGIYELWPELEAETSGVSHTRLSKCCQKYLEAAAKTAILTSAVQAFDSVAGTAENLRLDILKAFPLLKYSVNQVFYHTNEGTGAARAHEFLTRFDLKTWISLSNVITTVKTRRYTGEAPFLYALAIHNAGTLIKEYHKLYSPTTPCTPQERYKQPVLAAVANRSWDAVQAFLEPYQIPCLAEVTELLKAQRDVSVQKEPDLLYWALQKDQRKFAEMLLSCPKIDVNAKGYLDQTPLSLAVEKGHCEIFQQLLAHGANANIIVKGSRGDLLSLAISKDCVEIVKLMLVNGLYGEGELSSHLQTAVIQGHREIVKLLLCNGTDPGKDLDQLLQYSMARNDAEIVKLLLNDRPNCNAELNRLFWMTVNTGNIKLARDLMSQGANIDARDPNYERALYLATSRGDVKSATALLDFGVDFNMKAIPHGTPLQLASLLGHRGFAKWLLDMGVDVNAQGGKYGNALQAASLRGRIDLAKALLDRGVDVNAQGGKYGNALQAASLRGRIDLAKALLDRGAEVNAQGGHHGNALQAASVRGRTDLAKLLLDRGAEVNAQGGLHGNALQAAAYRGCIKTATLLLSKGANIYAQGLYKDAIQAAMKYGRTKMVKLLQKWPINA